jgi:hypothetical protein
MNLDHPALPVIILNAFIIGTVAAIALVLKEPLAILGLFWIQAIPQVEYEEYAPEDAVGEQGEYDNTEVGFTGKLKK